MKTISAIILAGGLLLVSNSAFSDDVADFYRSKTVTITSGGGAGGGYGLYATMLSQYLGKHIPGNPNVIVSFMQGAGGVRAANYAYRVAPKDGTVILGPLQSMPTLQLLGKKGIRYDAAKFNWIGRSVEVTSAFVVSRTVGTSLDALKRSGKETVVGITQPGAPNYVLVALVRYCTGMKLRLVSGYKGSKPLALAFQRHEVDGAALPLDSLRLVYSSLLKNTIIAQSGLKRARDFSKVPLVLELCPDPQKKKIVEIFQTQEVFGRSYALPPGTPPARVAALRHAFDATVNDPAFLAAAKKRKMGINPLPGAEVQQLVERHIATESKLVAKAKQAIGLK